MYDPQCLGNMKCMRHESCFVANARFFTQIFFQTSVIWLRLYSDIRAKKKIDGKGHCSENFAHPAEFHQVKATCDENSSQIKSKSFKTFRSVFLLHSLGWENRKVVVEKIHIKH